MPYADYNKQLKSNRERQKTPRGAANHARANKAYRQKRAERYRAHNAVNNAVRDGLLVPLPCRICGEKAEAHHPNYSRPLEVVWLCPTHHKQEHALLKEVA